MFEVVEGWGKLPPNYRFKEVAAVAVDSHGDLYVPEVTLSVVRRHETPPREPGLSRTWRG